MGLRGEGAGVLLSLCCYFLQQPASQMHTAASSKRRGWAITHR